MVAQKIFVSCLVTLIFFNLIFFLTGYNASFISYSSIVGIFLTLGIIAVVVAVIPLGSGGGTMSWFMSVIIVISFLYSISFSVLTYNITIGVGLATNLTNMFSSDINNIYFMPWLFFTVIGLLGTISGFMTMTGGQE